jgi:hypothetical protein
MMNIDFNIIDKTLDGQTYAEDVANAHKVLDGKLAVAKYFAKSGDCPLKIIYQVYQSRVGDLFLAPQNAEPADPKILASRMVECITFKEDHLSLFERFLNWLGLNSDTSSESIKKSMRLLPVQFLAPLSFDELGYGHDRLVD